MFILNATATVKSFMEGNGTLITIKPGELSQLLIASRNSIIAAIRMGNPDQVGIILQGSYEFDVAKSITAAAPYLYTDPDEAKAKLLKADIDYKGNLNAAKINLANETELKKKDKEIADLKFEIKKLNEELVNANDLNKIKQDLQSRLESATGELTKLQSSNKKLDTQLKESQDSVEALTSKVNDLRKSNGAMTQELTGLNAMIEKLTSENQSLTDELNIVKNNSANTSDLEANITKLNDEIKQLTEKYQESTRLNSEYTDKISSLEKLNSELKSNLEDASATIDNMRTEFNAACEKFQITKDENNEWIQLTKE